MPIWIGWRLLGLWCQWNHLVGTKIFYPYSSFPENPYAIAYQFINRSERNGVTGNTQLSYNFTKTTRFIGKNLGRLWCRAQGTKATFMTQVPKCQRVVFAHKTSLLKKLPTTFFKIWKEFSKDIKLTFTGGGSTLRNNYEREEMRPTPYLGGHVLSRRRRRPCLYSIQKQICNK